MKVLIGNIRYGYWQAVWLGAIRILPALLALVLLLFQAGCSGSGTFRKEALGRLSDDNTIRISSKAMRDGELTVEIVGIRSANQAIVTTGQVKVNENQLFHVNPFVTGRVVKDNVSLGDAVRQGQTLAVVQNLEVAKIQANFIHELHQNEIDVQRAKIRLELAQNNLAREKRLLAEGISPRKDYLQAQADQALAQSELDGQREHAVHISAEARALLSAYGVRPDNVHTERIQTSGLVTAPRAGVVIRKNVTVGDMVTPEAVMYEVADLSRVWLDVTVYPGDITRIGSGKPVRFTSDSLPGRTFTGVIDYIPPMVAESSQTLMVRAFLENPSGLLRPGMFGTVVLPEPKSRTMPYVPEAAVQKYGRETFVFLPLGQGLFKKRIVTLGEKTDGGYLVKQGLSPGERIVGKGSFSLKAELLKAQFADDEE